jgi:hypothetical protein
MIGEPRLLAAVDVFFHPESAERESWDIAKSPYPFEQFQTASIRQADVAQKNVEVLFRSDPQCVVIFSAARTSYPSRVSNIFMERSVSS